MQNNPQNSYNFGMNKPQQHDGSGAQNHNMSPNQGAPQDFVPQQGGTHPSEQKPPKKKRGAGFYITIIIAIVALAAAGFFAFQYFDGQKTSTRDPNGIIGQIDGKSEEEIRAELDRMVEEGMFNISIASQVLFDDGQSEGELKIENVPGNRYLMQVDITRDDTGELIYKSGILEPNYHIQTAKLDVDLPAGDYECTATFNALDPETEEQIGQAAARMNIRVLN